MDIGLSLSGGGVKGAAHIGVLKAIEEEKIKIDYISGTSSGSIVATLYAVGYSTDEIYDIFCKYCKQISYVSPQNILKLVYGLIFKGKIIIQGLNNGDKLLKMVNKMCKEKGISNISEIKIPILMPSVDLKNGQVYVFTNKNMRATYEDDVKYVNSINIGEAVRASCSYPGVFSPFKYGNVELIDGGIRENIPWKETKKMGADKVISVVFQKELEKMKENNIIEVITHSIDILSHELAIYEQTGAEYLIKIKTGEISLLDFSKIEYLYNEGYKEAKKQLRKIKNEIK